MTDLAKMPDAELAAELKKFADTAEFCGKINHATWERLAEAARRLREYAAEVEGARDRLDGLLRRIASIETRPQDKETWLGRAMLKIKADARAALDPQPAEKEGT